MRWTRCCLGTINELDAVLDILERTARDLCGPSAHLLLEAMRQDTGISLPMSQWALEHVRDRFSRDALGAYETRVDGELRGKSVLLRLARSVATGPLRSIFAAFARSPERLVVRPSSKQTAVVKLVVERLSANGAVGICLQTERNFDGYDVVIAFGSDETIARVAEAMPHQSVLEAYPHGYGVQLVDASVLKAADVRELAWDWAAYDGHGCLSPVIAFVAGATMLQTIDLVAQVYAALSAIEQDFSRQQADLAWRVHERNWRSQTAAGALLSRVGTSHSVHVMEFAQGIERAFSIGSRNVVLCLADREKAAVWIDQHARGITALGCSGGDWKLSMSGGARVSLIGKMQDPVFDGEADQRLCTRSEPMA